MHLLKYISLLSPGAESFGDQVHDGVMCGFYLLHELLQFFTYFGLYLFNLLLHLLALRAI